MSPRLLHLALLSLAVGALPTPSHGQTVAAPYNTVYTLANLGSITDLPGNYGGLAFLPGDNNTIVIGGAANTAAGKIYRVGVTRGTGGHITGFAGAATVYSEGANNDGGVTFGPGGVLFLARYPNNEIGQVEPGTTVTAKVTGLTALGVASSIGGFNFVPAGFPGAGQLKVASYNTSKWYSLPFAPDGTGTYTFSAATEEATISGGPEGFIYVPPGSPLFPDFQHILVSEYSAGAVTTYTVDSNGDPVPASRTVFVSGLSGAEGAVIDPVTGDFLFSTFGGGNRVVQVRGFAAPPTTTTTSTSSTTIVTTTTTTTTSTSTTSTSTTSTSVTTSSSSTSSTTTSTSSTSSTRPRPTTTTSTLQAGCVLAQLPQDSLAGVECAIETVQGTLAEPPQPQCASRCKCDLTKPVDRLASLVEQGKASTSRKACRKKLDAARRAAQSYARRIKSANKRSCLAPADRGQRLGTQTTELSARAKALFKSAYCASR